MKFRKILCALFFSIGSLLADDFANICTTFKASLEFLYFKPCVEQDICAFRGNAIVTFDTERESGHYENWDYSWRPGFRIFLGKDFAFGTMAGSYLYLNNKRSNQFSIANSDDILTSPINFGPFTNFAELIATHRFDYQNFDLFFELPFHLFCLDLLIPYVGIDGLVLNQRVDLKGTSEDSLQYFEERQKANYWGVGLKAGSTILYSLNSCWDLFGQFGGSMIYGPLDEEVNGQTLSSESANLNFHTTSHPNLLLTSLKLRIGFDFHMMQCSCPFTARIGYEFIEWFHLWAYRTLNPTIDNTTKHNRGNLQLNGLTLGLFISF